MEDWDRLVVTAGYLNPREPKGLSPDGHSGTLSSFWFSGSFPSMLDSAAPAPNSKLYPKLKEASEGAHQPKTAFRDLASGNCIVEG